jgi:hypothetical protein
MAKWHDSMIILSIIFGQNPFLWQNPFLGSIIIIRNCSKNPFFLGKLLLLFVVNKTSEQCQNGKIQWKISQEKSNICGQNCTDFSYSGFAGLRLQFSGSGDVFLDYFVVSKTSEQCQNGKIQWTNWVLFLLLTKVVSNVKMARFNEKMVTKNSEKILGNKFGRDWGLVLGWKNCSRPWGFACFLAPAFGLGLQNIATFLLIFGASFFGAREWAIMSRTVGIDFSVHARLRARALIVGKKNPDVPAHYCSFFWSVFWMSKNEQ